MRKSAIFVAGLFFPGMVHATLTVGTGAEYIQWREFDAVTDEKLVEESGLRFFVNAAYSHPVQEGLRLSYSAKFYGGQVDYDGQYQNGVAVTAETDYRGATGEVQAIFSSTHRDFTGVSLPSVDLGIGLDTWSREITAPGGYRENYFVPYFRLGLEQGASRRNPWSARLGVLHPIDVREEVDFYDGVDLQPQAKPSFYLFLGYQFTPQWELEFGYQGYRFGKSGVSSSPVTENGVPVDINGDGKTPDFVLQPKSELDTYSVNVIYWF